MLDINVGMPGIEEPAVLREVVTAVSAHVCIPLCLDSNNPVTLATGLEVVKGRPFPKSSLKCFCDTLF